MESIWTRLIETGKEDGLREALSQVSVTPSGRHSIELAMSALGQLPRGESLFFGGDDTDFVVDVSLLVLADDGSISPSCVVVISSSDADGIKEGPVLCGGEALNLIGWLWDRRGTTQLLRQVGEDAGEPIFKSLEAGTAAGEWTYAPLCPAHLKALSLQESTRGADVCLRIPVRRASCAQNHEEPYIGGTGRQSLWDD